MSSLQDIFLLGKNLTLSKLVFNNIKMEEYLSSSNSKTKTIEISNIGKALIVTQKPKQIYFPHKNTGSLGVVLEEYDIFHYYEEEERELILRYVPLQIKFIGVDYRVSSVKILEKVLLGISANFPIYIDNDRGTILPINDFLQRFYDLV